jgi:hypothetical protein
VSRRVHVTLDEGGLRRSEGDTRDAHDYLAYDGIVDVELRTRMLRSPAVLALVHGGAERIVFVGPEALEIHRALVEHLASRRARSPTRAPEAWRRMGRPLPAWLAALEARGDVGYREDGGGLALARAVLDDADADIEVRAAAAHLLVRFADDDDLAAAAKVLIARALPPLVIAAAWLAEGGPTIVTGARVADALRFLAPEDRSALLTADLGVEAPQPPVSARHADAVARAAHDIAEEARRSSSAPPAERGRARHGFAGADRDTSRWIGKSWGL